MTPLIIEIAMQNVLSASAQLFQQALIPIQKR